jgi:hypothetical protein
MTSDLHALATLGCQFVQLASNGKRPLGNAWHTLASSIADVIDGWLSAGSNLGLLLGTGNIIDVEYDDEVGRLALARMGLLDIRTPTWASGRGEHRLFRLDATLPPIGWKKVGGAEIRIGGKPAQSVLPPSMHPTGSAYRWLVSPCDVAPAAVTLRMLGLEG